MKKYLWTIFFVVSIACVLPAEEKPAFLRLQHHSGDRYFAKDKLYHFMVSAGLAFGSYYGYREGLRNSETGSYYFSGGLTLSIGALKEYYDYRHPEFHCSSWKDFIADLAGTAAGLALAYIVFE